MSAGYFARVVPALALLGGAAAASACPFCSGPSLTLSEQVDRSDVALFVAWRETSKPSPDGSRLAWTKYEVLETLPGRDRGLSPGDVVTAIDYQPSEAGRSYLLTGYFDGIDEKVIWDPPTELPRGGFGYVRDAPSPEEPTPDRLRYFVRFLEHGENAVANDAYGEFANSPYEKIASIADAMPREDLARWVADEEIDPARLGLYGLLLGTCGGPDEAGLLGEIVLAPSDDIRIGLNGLMSGYLLAAGEPGLEKLVELKLAAETVPGPDGEPVDVPFSETYAAMQAVGFLWTYARDRFEDEAILAAMRTLLDRPDMADFAVRDLARWKDWSIGDRLFAMYGRDGQPPAVRRAIVRYYLAATKDAADHPTEAAAARAHLEELTELDPETVEDVRSYELLFD